MRIFWKDKEISCDEDVVEQLNIVRLPERERNEYNDILNFLNNPSNELNYYLIAKRFFNIKFTSDDLLEYLRYRDNKQYTKVVTIPVDKIVLEPMPGLFDTKVVYLHNLGIKCACEDSFELQTKKYSVDEIKELVDKKILCPIKKEYIKFSTPLNKLTNIKVYQKELDKFQYIGNLKQNITPTDEYFSFFINKMKQKISEKALMIVVRRKISELFTDVVNTYYEDVYYCNDGENEKKYYLNGSKSVQVLIEKYNNYASNNGLKLISNREIDVFLENIDNINDDALSAYLDTHNLNNEDTIKLKKAISKLDFLGEDLAELLAEKFNVNEFASEIIIENNENMAIEFLGSYKDELDFLTKCKLLRVILNSNNEDAIDLIVEYELLSESNVKKYINKRK